MQNKHTQNQVFYLIVDKQSKIVKDFTDKEQAENYVKERPYLRVSELDLTQAMEEIENPLFQHEMDDLPF